MDANTKPGLYDSEKKGFKSLKSGLSQKDNKYVPKNTEASQKPYVEEGINVKHFNPQAVKDAKEYSERIRNMPEHPSQVNETLNKLKLKRYDSDHLYGSGALEAKEPQNNSTKVTTLPKTGNQSSA